MHEIAGQAAVDKRHLDFFDLYIGQADKAVEAIDPGLKGVERLLVFGRAEALGHLVIVTGAQIGVTGRGAEIAGFKFFRIGAHPVGDRDAGIEPGAVVIRRLAFEQGTDLVQLTDFGAAIGGRTDHIDKGRRPAVVAGKIHEIRRIFFFSHDRSLSGVRGCL